MLTEHGIEDGEEFSGHGDGRDLGRFAVRLETFVEGFERRIEATGAERCHAQRIARVRPPQIMRLPRRVPESRLSGATPTSLAMPCRLSWPSSGRSNSASTLASSRLVLANCPAARAKLRTCRGLTTATATPAAASAVAVWRCKPPVASIATMSTPDCLRSASSSVGCLPVRRTLRDLAVMFYGPHGHILSANKADGRLREQPLPTPCAVGKSSSLLPRGGELQCGPAFHGQVEIDPGRGEVNQFAGAIHGQVGVVLAPELL